MIVWMYVLREFEDALDDCQVGCINCNDDPVHAWDEGVAFYTGSSHGTAVNSIMTGYLIYSLANKRCANFKTCSASGDSVVGNAKVNIDLLNLFERGKSSLQGGRCNAARNRKDKIAKIMAIPALQGTLRYAYITGPQNTRTPKAIGEGAVFAAAVLPIVHACSPSDAQIIYDNMNAASTSTNFAAVKEAFERNYDCMGISCLDVGGYFDQALNEYFPGAAPCVDNPDGVVTFPPGICFDGESTVQVKGVDAPVAMDDVKIGDYVLADNGEYDLVYSFGHYGPSEKATFLSVTTDSLPEPLKISEDHLLFIETASGRKSIPASNLLPGNQLIMAEGALTTVESIKFVKSSGVYAPFTMSGKIVVNGIVASSYVTMQSESDTLIVAGWKSPLTYQWLGHVLQTPHRMLCRLSWSQCQSETYAANGVSNWVKSSLDLSVWFLNQGTLLSSLLFVFGLLPLLVLFLAVEFVATNPTIVACTVGAVFIASKASITITTKEALQKEGKC